MNAFIVYVALPALFFNLVSRTPFAELANGSFVALTITATACAFALAFATGLLSHAGASQSRRCKVSRARIPISAIWDPA
jgi:malonate transporter and related proteins